MSGYDEVLLPGEDVFAEPNLREEQRIGGAAQALIQSEPYKLVTAAMQERIWEGFKSCPIRDEEGLQYLRVLLKCVTDMHEMLEDAARTGKMASIQLTEKQEPATHADEV